MTDVRFDDAESFVNFIMEEFDKNFADIKNRHIEHCEKDHDHNDKEYDERKRLTFSAEMLGHLLLKCAGTELHIQAGVLARALEDFSSPFRLMCLAQGTLLDRAISRAILLKNL